MESTGRELTGMQPTDMQPLELLRNLMIVAAVDGVISKPERKQLEQYRKQWNISSRQFQAALAEAQHPDAQLSYPEKPHQRVDYLYDLVAIVAADGILDPSERRLCEKAADAMQISRQHLQQVLDELLDDDELLLGDS